MNPENYASLEASKRLVEAGIVLDTETRWRRNAVNGQWYLTSQLDVKIQNTTECPAPSTAEVWGELPEGFQQSASVPVMWREGERYYTAYMQNFRITSKYFMDTNPTDALIDLLIWVRKER